jgi:hypothetical protein
MLLMKCLCDNEYFYFVLLLRFIVISILLNLLLIERCRYAADNAYQAVQLKPDQMNVAEVHDCFGVAELLMYEALGFAPYGKGLDLLKSGATQIDGKIPVNTGGGLMAFGHPVGATGNHLSINDCCLCVNHFVGVKQVFEIYKQMKGKSGDYQIKNIPQFGITANMGM